MKSLLIPTLVLALSGVASAETLRLRGPNYYPYTGAADSSHPGFMVEVARDIFALHGIDIQYGVLPWNRLLEGTDKGRYDCLLGIHPSEEPRLDYTQEPWAVMAPHIYVRKDDPLEYEDLTSFKRRRVAVIKDSRMAEALKPFKKMAPERLLEFDEWDGVAEMVRKLRLGEVDVVALPKVQMEAYLNATGFHELVRDAGLLTKPVPLYVACTTAKPDAEQWLKWLSEDVLTLKREGRWQELETKYGLR
ncbi:transporter substrate-binding domain-containing protein [Gallaecimonas sp. GXIMD4217]|uniref:substrate-binding periplasmic protein n=1 Tax=Gallaecimonas sp. GXIMD4217 TaxID=3131927 RepID=UPI00311B2520